MAGSYRMSIGALAVKIKEGFLAKLCLKSRKSFLDRVSTGSGSDLFSD
jgi:hypothetical protein